MGPNLRSLVTKANRVRQGRTFSSSAPNPIGDKGTGSVIDSVWGTMNRFAPYFVVGFSVKFCLDMSALLKSSQKSDDLHQAYMRELGRNREEKVAEIEQLAPVTGFSEE